MQRLTGISSTLGLTLAAACVGNRADGPNPSEGPPLGDTGAHETDDLDPDGANDSEGDDDPHLDLAVFDVPSGGEGCGKVDFLFVIDSSVSMGNEQDAMIASFPGFIDTIQATLSAENDYHIMVVDTDAESRCTPETCMAPDARVQDLCIDDGESGYACTASFSECDRALGAGVINPSGEGSSNRPCTLATGDRYLTFDEADLGAAFSCVAQLGLAGHSQERPMDAMVAAMADDINGPGGCNEGFLRDDAILVITAVSDDAKYNDEGTPQDWYDAIVTAKHGDPQAVVVLGLFPNPPDCVNKAGAGDHWREFVGLWGDHGVLGEVCADEYGSFFQSAVDIIDTTCDEFTPPG